MSVKVLLFAVARQWLGTSEIIIDLPAACRVRDLRAELAARHPQLSQHMASLRIAVDNAYASDDTAIGPTSEVALIPPVSGG